MTSAKRGLLLVLGLALVAGLLLAPLPGAWRGIWQSKVLDLGHVPLFAALTLFLSAGRGLAPGSGTDRTRSSSLQGPGLGTGPQ